MSLQPPDPNAGRSRKAAARGSSAPELEPGLELETLITWAIGDLQRLLTRSMDRRFRAAGLPFSRAQQRVLFVVHRMPGLTQTELADLIEAEKAPLGKLLDRLEQQGYVERRADKMDRRAKRIFLTGKIDSFRKRGVAAGKALFDDAFAGVPAREKTALLDILHRVKNNLARAEGGA